MRDIHGRTDGPPPPVDLAHDKKVGDFMRKIALARFCRSQATLIPSGVPILDGHYNTARSSGDASVEAVLDVGRGEALFESSAPDAAAESAV